MQHRVFIAFLCGLAAFSCKLCGKTGGRACPHTLYDTECAVSRENHKTPAIVSAFNGSAVSLLYLQNTEQYAAGYVEWQDKTAGITQRRAILNTAQNTLVLMGGTRGIEVGLTLSCFMGCNQTSILCHSRFNNIDNYGGFRHLPGKSPFDGDPMF